MRPTGSDFHWLVRAAQLNCRLDGRPSLAYWDRSLDCDAVGAIAHSPAVNDTVRKCIAVLHTFCLLPLQVSSITQLSRNNPEVLTQSRCGTDYTHELLT